MKLPWSKQNRTNSVQDHYNKTLKDLMDARRAEQASGHTLDEFIKIGNRDVGLDEESEVHPMPAVPEASPPPPAASPAPAPQAHDESLAELSMEELARLISSSDPDPKP